MKRDRLGRGQEKKPRPRGRGRELNRPVALFAPVDAAALIIFVAAGGAITPQPSTENGGRAGGQNKREGDRAEKRRPVLCLL